MLPLSSKFLYSRYNVLPFSGISILYPVILSVPEVPNALRLYSPSDKIVLISFSSAQPNTSFSLRDINCGTGDICFAITDMKYTGDAFFELYKSFSPIICPISCTAVAIDTNTRSSSSLNKNPLVSPLGLQYELVIWTYL